jgi:hypothetical protein
MGWYGNGFIQVFENGNESERRKGKGLVLQIWGLGIAAILESGAGAEGGAQGGKNRLDWVGFPRFFALTLSLTK